MGTDIGWYSYSNLEKWKLVETSTIFWLLIRKVPNDATTSQLILWKFYKVLVVNKCSIAIARIRDPCYLIFQLICTIWYFSHNRNYHDNVISCIIFKYYNIFTFQCVCKGVSKSRVSNCYRSVSCHHHVGCQSEVLYVSIPYSGTSWQGKY